MPSSTKSSIIIYLVLLALHIALVWWTPFFPTQDGPSHLYNLVILYDLLNGGREWGAYFDADLRFVPNLGFHIVAYPLISFLPPLVVEKLFVSIYIIMMGIAVPIFLRSFDRPIFPISFMTFPVVFNFTLFMGFYSYVIAVPLFLIAFAIAWKERHGRWLFRLLFLNLAGVVIFCFHLIPFVFFLIALAVAATVEKYDWRGKLAALLRLMVTVSPLLALFLNYQIGNSHGGHFDLSYLMSFQRFVDLTEHLFFFSTTTFTKAQATAAALSLFLFLFFLAVFFLDSLKSSRYAGSDANPLTASEKTLLLLAMAFVAIYYVAPFRLGEGSYFNQRFPWVILLILLPLLRIPGKSDQSRFASFIILCSIIPVFYFNILALRHESDRVKEFLGGLDVDLPTGAFIMGYKTKFPEWSDIDVLMHTASYYGLYKRCVDIGNYEAGLPYFPVRFKSTLPPFPSQDTIAYEPAKINWSLYPCIGYLFAWDMKQGERESLEKEFNIIKDTGRLTVWERKPPYRIKDIHHGDAETRRNHIILTGYLPILRASIEQSERVVK
jgi:hypothetical protein